MKKTIKDLKINDSVFIIPKTGFNVTERSIKSISNKHISFDSGFDVKLEDGDHLSWRVDFYRFGDSVCFLSKKDALKFARKNLDSKLKMLFVEQGSFLKRIEEVVSKIRNNEYAIAKEIEYENTGNS